MNRKKLNLKMACNTNSFHRIGVVNVREALNELLIMFIVCESMMNTLLVSILPIDNLLGYAMLLTAILVLLVQPLKIDYGIMIVIIICILSFILAWMKGYMSETRLYLIQFASFGMVGIVGARLEFDCNKIFKAVVYVSEVFILLNLINKGMIESDFNFGYALIPGVLSSVFLIYNSWKNKSVVSIMKYGLLALPILVMFVFRSSRGNFVQLMIFLLLSMFFLFGQKFLALLITGVGVAGIIYLRPIVTFLNDWANSHGLTIGIIWKTYYLLNTSGQSIFHGREELFDVFRENVDLGTYVFGNGIGAYEHVADTYPHNIFLSAFSDFGLIGVAFIICMICMVLKILNDKKGEYSLIQKEFILLVFTLSYVKLFFSGVYWNSSTFWFMVSFLLFNKSRKWSLRDVVSESNI